MAHPCPYCKTTPASSLIRTPIVRIGVFLRACDQARVQRFFCKICRKSFSRATRHPCFLQKKRAANPSVFSLLVSGVSQRRSARILNLNRKTIVRKFLFLANQAQTVFKAHRSTFPLAHNVEFDDLESFEHSKLKPLSVIAMVESNSRRILGFRVAKMPAKGLLVKRSLKKYGKRPDERKKHRQELFRELAEFVDPRAVIRSDENPHYTPDVRVFFPNATHKTTPGRRGCVVGQGELKAGGFDPIFSLNHTFAMFRANINRLFRRTWNTTKKPDRLQNHIWLYCLWHNLSLDQ